MLASALSLSSLALPTPSTTGDWKVKQAQFSAVSVGVGFQSDSVGWSFFTDGSSGVQTVRTTDGGMTFTPVTAGDPMVMPMSAAAALTSSSSTTAVATVGMLANTFSTDGETFVRSTGTGGESQSVQMTSDHRTISANDQTVSLSVDGGKTYTSSAAMPVTEETGGGRYAAWPSKDVIFVSAGRWPEHTARLSSMANSKRMQLSSKIAVTHTVARGANSFNLQRMEYPTPLAPLSEGNTTGYGAAIYKSSDGGATWKSVFSDTNNFYFNGIDCFDETHCIAAGEGFSEDGSGEPGARAYITTDGETFTKVFHDTIDGTSLMAAKMFSASSYQIGGRGAPSNNYVAQVSTDGGKTHTPLGVDVHGQMITAFGFVSEAHGYATTVNDLQISSLLEFKNDAVLAARK